MQKFQYLDKKQHGTPDFPVEYYFVDSNHPRYTMAFHWHQEWELLRVLEGKFLLSLDDTTYTLSAGDAVLISPETLHGGEPEDCVYECLVFDLYGLFKKVEILKSYFTPFYQKEWVPGPLLPGNESPVADLMDVFWSPHTTCPEPKVLAGLLGLFTAIITTHNYQVNTPNQAQSKQWSHRIKAVLEYIEGHYSENLSLDMLAQVAGMNARYFCRVFDSLTHHTPMNYVNLYRIEHAAFLLESTDQSMTQIAAECGFWESSYFTKVFKKVKGCTPKTYRANIKKAVSKETAFHHSRSY